MTVITPSKSGTLWDERLERERAAGEDAPDLFENSLDNSCSPEIDAEPERVLDPSQVIDSIKRILQWIRNGSNARAKEIRVQAAFYYLDQKNQVALAREIGVKKATISQQAVAFKDYFELKRTAGAASNMRSDQARQTFSEVCKSNHQKRKASQDSTALPMTSVECAWKPPTLREIASQRAAQPSSSHGRSEPS